MSPDNVDCLTAAGINCCALANNHVLDWGRDGLLETLRSLRRSEIKTCGAGENVLEAELPARLKTGKGAEVVVFSLGVETSGIPRAWAADAKRPGVNWLPDLSPSTIKRVTDRIARHRRQDDIVVVSIHWGDNWGYTVTSAQRQFAQQLVENGVDVVHGHSSHHPKGIEIYQDRLILYGCGDFVTDYEGITGHERFRGDLGLMYFVKVDASGKLAQLQMVPMQMHRMQLRRPTTDDVRWLHDVLNRESASFGTQVRLDDKETLTLERKRGS
jgi:poly-gamma-glutamate synthesis protein (capsule biosynthesis protein)